VAERKTEMQAALKKTQAAASLRVDQAQRQRILPLFFESLRNLIAAVLLAIAFRSGRRMPVGSP
jgi:hypothetical protein